MTSDKKESWASAWPDAFAFVLWLVIAWFARWNATDLVWSLWLSSLVIGYALILWTVFRPAEQLAWGIWRTRPKGEPERTASSEMSPLGQESVIGIGALFVLGYYTAIFAFANYLASGALIMYFPLDGEHFRIWPSFMSLYDEIARRYWYFLPAAFLAARGAFLKNPLPEAADPRTFEKRPRPEFIPPPEMKQVFKSKTTWIGVRAITPGSAPYERIDSLGAPGSDRDSALTDLNKPTTGLREAFRGVTRMNFLIIVFWVAQMAHLDNFPLYVVVYSCFFFPWRLVSRDTSPATATGTAPVG